MGFAAWKHLDRVAGTAVAGGAEGDAETCVSPYAASDRFLTGKIPILVTVTQ